VEPGTVKRVTGVSDRSDPPISGRLARPMGRSGSRARRHASSPPSGFARAGGWLVSMLIGP
jgi:hypothetical protein